MLAKNFYFLLFIFGINAFLSTQENANFLYGDIKWGIAPTYSMRIQFDQEKYSVLYEVGGYFTNGQYKVEGNKVTLIYPELNLPANEYMYHMSWY